MNYDGGVSIRYEKVSMEDADTFFSAVADGDYDTTVKMLDEGRANVNQTDSDGFSALMIAASEGHEKLVKELIDRDCNVSSVTLNKNNTSLFFAAKGGNVEIGKMILAKNKKLINQCNFLGETPLLWACYSGNFDFYKYLLSQNAEVRAMSANDTTCLIGACLGPEPSRSILANHILSLCPKIIDVQDVDGQSALHVAASSGNVACVTLLLEAGADSTLRDVEGLTPLQQAEKSCYPQCAEILETKWKELEEKAKEEMEELLRAEGYDQNDIGTKRGKKGKKNKRGKTRLTTEVNSIHPDYRCDNCGDNKYIVGVRYSCSECTDYDLCEKCFTHTWDFHSHTHFMAYPPPQYDIFGMLKEGEGTAVIAPLQPPPSSPSPSTPSSPMIASPTPTITSTPIREPVPAPLTTSVSSVIPVVKEEMEMATWTVVGEKKRRSRPTDLTGLDREVDKKRGGAKAEKMNYKRAIQKSMSKEDDIPRVRTGIVQSVQSPLLPSAQPVQSPLLPSVQPVQSPLLSSIQPVQSPIQPSIQPVQSPIQPSVQPVQSPLLSSVQPVQSPLLSSFQPLQSLTVDMISESITEPPVQSFLPSASEPSAAFNIMGNFDLSGSACINDASYHKDYRLNPTADDLSRVKDMTLGFGTNDGYSLRYDTPYDGYYSYDRPSLSNEYGTMNSISTGLNADWWPNSHYSTWREREVDVEREQWLFNGNHSLSRFSIDDDVRGSVSAPSYSSDELQRNLELSNPQVRSIGLQVSQVIGLDLDIANDQQLSALLEVHMDAIKQITAMKVRLAKNNERQRLLQQRDVYDIAQTKDIYH